MTEVYETEKKAIAEGKSTRKNLMTSLAARPGISRERDSGEQ
jgi:hypothetical protein